MRTTATKILGKKKYITLNMVETKFNSIVIEVPKKMGLTRQLKNGREKRLSVPSLTKTGNPSTRKGKKSIKLKEGEKLKIISSGVSHRNKDEEEKLKDIGKNVQKIYSKNAKEFGKNYGRTVQSYLNLMEKLKTKYFNKDGKLKKGKKLKNYNNDMDSLKFRMRNEVETNFTMPKIQNRMKLEDAEERKILTDDFRRRFKK